MPVSVSAKSAAEALPRRPAGVFAEVRPAAVAWISDVARILTRGYLLALDYGFSRKERLAPHRMRGTFASYKNHHRDENLLADPGERDLTAHVDFSDLAGAGLAAGLVPVGFCDQHHFMIGAASKLLKTLDGTDPASDPHKLLHSLKTLMHPETMGTRFQAFAMTTHPDLATCLPAFRASWDGFSELIP
jgi:SAM-dependent MidA family methyltransferase